MWWKFWHWQKADDARKELVVGFDGVLHSYVQSGWQGASVISDPPVPGALEWLVQMVRYYRVHIVSSRSHQWGGRRAMRRWVREELRKFALHRDRFGHRDKFKLGVIMTDQEAVNWATTIAKHIGFPRHKPPAHLTIDDRAYCFRGTFPDRDQIDGFRPWNKGY